MLRARNIVLLILLGFVIFAGSVRETYQIHPGICDGCAECALSCPNSAISYDMNLHCMRIDQTLCDGCGDCELICPLSAIYLNDARSFIMGTVTDSSTQFGMRHAVIEADTCTTVSGLFGDYCLTLYEGTYDVICRADGYEDRLVEDVVVPADTVIRMDFVMIPQNDIDDSCNDNDPFDIRCFPNPVTTGGNVMLSLPEGQSGSIDIFNARGQRVRTITASDRSSSTSWDTRDDQGKQLTPGVYLYRVRSGRSETNGKILLFR